MTKERREARTAAVPEGERTGWVLHEGAKGHKLSRCCRCVENEAELRTRISLSPHPCPLLLPKSVP